MRVIQPPAKENIKAIEYKQAIEECKYCPCCGSDNIDTITSIFPNEYRKIHFFWDEKYTTKEFRCRQCGCKFESDPYDTDTSVGEIFMFTIKVIYILCVIIFLLGVEIGAIAISISGIIVILNTTLLLIGNNIYKKHKIKYTFQPYEVHRKIGD